MDISKKNVREYRKGNEKLSPKRNWQHRVHKTKTNKTQHRETGNIGYTRRRQTNTRIKTMFGSSLTPVVCKRAHVLFTLFVAFFPK
jgi:hypothetical protein